MNGMLPENLRVPAPADPEVSEDFRYLLEEIIQQNAEILERLDNKANKPTRRSLSDNATIAIIIVALCASLGLFYIFN